MRLIDADALTERCGEWYCEEGPEEGYIGTLKNLIAEQPTAKPEPARLLTPEDFDGNPDVDILGRVPAWYEPRNNRFIGGWTTANAEGTKSHFGRFWTARPTEEQRKATPWPEEENDEAD